MFDRWEIIWPFPWLNAQVLLRLLSVICLVKFSIIFNYTYFLKLGDKLDPSRLCEEWVMQQTLYYFLKIYDSVI